MTSLQLNHFTFQELLTVEGLSKLDNAFLKTLEKTDLNLSEQLQQYRHGQLSNTQISELVIACAPILEKFIATLFNIEAEVDASRDSVRAYDTLFESLKKNEKIFHPIKKKNYTNLVPIEPVENDPYARFEGPKETRRERDGFTLTDARMSLAEVLDEIHYCVYCHKNEGDFCSKGFPVKKNNPEMGLKINPAGDILTGCPLEEKISEMHVVKKSGHGIGALAIITIDNPMCAVTGHRICNDCMKACIYQKQDPVNIPEIETRVLTDVLNLPWGVEIYDLLIRWNPLRQTQYTPKPYNNSKIAVMGMGPAGFTLAHHLLMEGCAVVGFDGLKIEPLPENLISNPIYDFNSIIESLDDRIIAGFGGVAEYGITVRWDKNFLKLIYISLMRRQHFQLFGNVRFGGTITVENAWELGFDHVAITVGAGLPRELNIPNSLAPGMRQANDFLMALQLTGSAKKSSITNLQVQLPSIIVGGGLTGIDTATEVQAYYITQVEKIHQRYHILKSYSGEETLRAQFDTHSLLILDEFLLHADKIIAERERAKKENRKPQLNKLIREWGGVTVAYRKSIQESPAYQRNHEEVIKALEEGIYYAEGLEPASVVLDEYGATNALVCRWRIQDESGHWIYSTEEQMLPAKSLFIATGAKPNIAYEFEHRGTFVRNNDAYQSYDLSNQETPNTGHVKIDNCGIFTSYHQDYHRVSFLGDTHSIFHGSVVKAIASAKRGYPKIMEVLKSGSGSDYASFSHNIKLQLSATVMSVVRHTNNIIELIVHAPLAAKQFQPGQFYRLQNYETTAEIIDDTKLQTEAISALGIFNAEKSDQLSFMIYESGSSTKLISRLTAGESIALMGPTGAKTVVPTEKQSILIVGNVMALIYLLSVGSALKAAGHTIYFIANLKSSEHIAMDRIKQISDHISFCDTSNKIIDEMQKINLKEIKTISVIGSSSILKTIQHARSTTLCELINPETKFTASVYGSMQCMLKGVCAQCLQWQIDPVTGKRTKAVYACSWQHQPMELVDINNIDERLGQNRTQEILTNLWVQYLLENGNGV
ncbi:MAG: pyridine nucleotide-disulfide oxidoreductase [Gammaproteobacteria bacterium RIFCSPHIGHO2_02_FULL_39_13]|nr:MAG: pyridine nucleotide-disulfide oxidoreductase [Gammaproteobacteria bacterium RIFCSPHIGHO2_02_FULL_39_13]OGT50161.1 MAG: pyridine nucleotide-disulfide oxidoreductase [Gammaproteobacteria bacterium RIFCSPHIGHO2_12_FULL_39_24]